MRDEVISSHILYLMCIIFYGGMYLRIWIYAPSIIGCHAFRSTKSISDVHFPRIQCSSLRCLQCIHRLEQEWRNKQVFGVRPNGTPINVGQCTQTRLSVGSGRGIWNHTIEIKWHCQESVFIYKLSNHKHSQLMTLYNCKQGAVAVGYNPNMMYN